MEGMHHEEDILLASRSKVMYEQLSEGAIPQVAGVNPNQASSRIQFSDQISSRPIQMDIGDLQSGRTDERMEAYISSEPAQNFEEHRGSVSMPKQADTLREQEAAKLKSGHGEIGSSRDQKQTLSKHSLETDQQNPLLNTFSPSDHRDQADHVASVQSLLMKKELLFGHHQRNSTIEQV